jgi:hypothetical protein
LCHDLPVLVRQKNRKQGDRGVENVAALELKVPTAPPARLLDGKDKVRRFLPSNGRIFNRPARYRMMETVCGASFCAVGIEL